MSTKIYDVAIIGSGPAGMSAGIYAKRSNLDIVMIEKQMPGGKVALTSVVENYPGFESIDGPTLAFKMYEQLNKLEVPYLFNEVVDLKIKDDNLKEVYLNDGQIILAKAVIVATGTINRKINIPGEVEFDAKGISYCAICDGPLYKDKEVSVIGSGNSAVEEAIFLSSIASKVHLIANKPAFKAEPKLVEILNNTPNIIQYFNKDTKEFIGDEILKGVRFVDKITNEETILNVDANFTFIGLLPAKFNTSEIKIFDEQSGFIIVDNNMSIANQNGIFAAGDITNKSIRQITTATNDGTIAALYAKEYVSRNW